MDTVEVVLILGGVLALSGGYFWWARAQRRAATDAPVGYFRCPSCRRRVAYRERHVGHKVKCPGCGKDLTFPPVSQGAKG